MKFRFTFTAPFLVIALSFAFSGCHLSRSASDGEDEPTVPAANAVTMAVSAVRAAVAPIRSELRLLGTTAAAHHVQLRVPSAGRVLEFNLQNGDRVRRGEVVAHILNREVEAAVDGLAVAQQLDPTEAPALAQSVSRYTRGRGVAVIVPQDGIVSNALVSNGQMVNDADPIADLIDPRSVYVEAAVPIGNLASIRPGMPATVISQIVPGVELPARVAALSPSFVPNGTTSSARVEFTTGQRITVADAPVEVNISIASEPAAIVIPIAALFVNADTNGYYVFVAGADRRAHRTPINTGLRSGDLVQVTSGVRAGDLVITSGGFAVADGLHVKVTGASQ
jgi:multidrug efflux pump subunit AcrA (membrane-fusion protein)